MGQQQRDEYIGREILDGQFKILKRIGVGGMGAVYKAAQPEMNRMVAVKILHTKLNVRSDLVSRFRREARAMSHLSHPNTVKVFMYGELDDGSLYIVMEYLEGKNLNQVVRRQGPLSVERAIPILIQVCGALQEAHDQGIVHRDLKPENIFLCKSGGMDDVPKVLDFGLAKVTERELRPGSVMLTQEGMVFGTPEFMSPEQAKGMTLDARSDIYSLAVILYEALTGKLPFEAKMPMEFIQLHVTKPPIHLDQRVPGVTFPPGLGDVLDKALAKRRKDRYASAALFAEALGPYAPAGGAFGAHSAAAAPFWSHPPPAAAPWDVAAEAQDPSGPVPAEAEAASGVGDTVRIERPGAAAAVSAGEAGGRPGVARTAASPAGPAPAGSAVARAAKGPSPRPVAVGGGLSWTMLALVAVLSVVAGVLLTLGVMMLIR